MEKEINIKEILRNAPCGLKLYSPCYGELELFDSRSMIFLDEAGCRQYFFDDGRICNHGEVMLFPSKEKQNWNEWEILLFRNGDFLTNKDSNEVRFFSKTEVSESICSNGKAEFIYDYTRWRYATEHEKEAFGTELKNNGFCIRNGILETLNPEPIFKVGDMITSKDGWGVLHARIREVNKTSYVCDIDHGTATISLTAQHLYEKVNEDN